MGASSSNILKVSNKCLLATGLIILVLSVIGILKFFIYVLVFLLSLIYSLSVCTMGELMILSSLSFYIYARKYGGAPSYACAVLISFVGVGYFLLGCYTFIYLYIPSETNLFGIGIATTIVKSSLFFYGFVSIFLFFESRNGQIGGYGGLLILLFSSATFMYVFSVELIRTLPGAIITSLSGIGYILQGIALDRIFEPPRFRYPPPVRKRHIKL